MFRGINAISLDGKGRISVPRRYRQQLLDDAAGLLVATIETEARCLLLYPMPAWEQIEDKIEALPSFNPKTRRIQRLLLGHASEVEMDKQGRLLLPPLLRDYAHISKKAILLGQGKKFEIWDETTWQTQREGWLNEKDPFGGLPTQLDDLAL
jgi:MraZ protein